MDEGIDDFSEQNEVLSVSKNETAEKSTLNPEILQTPLFSSSDFSSMETFLCTSTIMKHGSTKRLFEERIVPNTAIAKVELNATLTSNAKSLEPVMDLAESKTECEELLESLILQTEETEEMLEIISRAKEKLESFISSVKDFPKCLQKISKHSDAKNGGRNTHLKSIYRKKLLEFASDLLDKINKSIKDLEADYETLKDHSKNTAETFEKITKFLRTSDPCVAQIGKKIGEMLKETVTNLAEELYLLKPRQLSDVEKVFYIKTDIDMLYDLYRRSSNIESSNIIGF